MEASMMYRALGTAENHDGGHESHPDCAAGIYRGELATSAGGPEPPGPSGAGRSARRYPPRAGCAARSGRRAPPPGPLSRPGQSRRRSPRRRARRRGHRPAGRRRERRPPPRRRRRGRAWPCWSAPRRSRSRPQSRPAQAAAPAPDVKSDRDGGAASQRPERRAQPAFGEDRRVDAAGDLAQLVQNFVHLGDGVSSRRASSPGPGAAAWSPAGAGPGRPGAAALHHADHARSAGASGRPRPRSGPARR